MKKNILSLGIFIALLMFSCEGPEGPPGRDGVDGAPGDYIIGQTYEIANINFSSNKLNERFTFPESNVDGDAVLVYRLEAVDNGLDVWEPLPTATIFFDGGGYFQYRFNYTLGDVDIIAESDDIDAVGAEFTKNQVFRIIVMPADLASTMDTNNINAVMSQLNITENDIQDIQ
ncbi:collagen-like protein [Tamlana sp. 2_MG-2023]|uniref:collagen-like protein n=1 Tax=unclassified Tamlana TaxID=2614803 RepID=UPI0026E19E3B|nr:MULTISPECIES: collagen-like protein [unclassified Tamlana]MDO6759254.1 collagen-like protein [Tamlana sp. 2_MG-2023]MDO6790607.1 collagen-like protein [Tamlana sp. 1_MG-2023]